jgi:hypothetical protein
MRQRHLLKHCLDGLRKSKKNNGVKARPETSLEQSYLFFSARLLYMFRVLPAPIIRSTIKTADVVTGTVHVSVWFKSVERCPRSGVYFTMSWPS